MNGLHKLYILVDDDPEILVRHSDYLKKLLHPGIEIQTFMDGQEMINFFEREPYALAKSIVITDFSMPIVGGDQVALYLIKKNHKAFCIRSSLDLESIRKKLDLVGITEKIPVYSKFRNIDDMDIFILSNQF